MLLRKPTDIDIRTSKAWCSAWSTEAKYTEQHKASGSIQCEDSKRQSCTALPCMGCKLPSTSDCIERGSSGYRSSSCKARMALPRGIWRHIDAYMYYSHDHIPACSHRGRSRQALRLLHGCGRLSSASCKYDRSQGSLRTQQSRSSIPG
jgi:hypothetical protein